jgi:hypothetical protein
VIPAAHAYRAYLASKCLTRLVLSHLEYVINFVLRASFLLRLWVSSSVMWGTILLDPLGFGVAQGRLVWLGYWQEWWDRSL